MLILPNGFEYFENYYHYTLFFHLMFAELPLHGRKTESKTKSLSRIEPYSVYSKLNIDADIGWLRERSHITLAENQCSITISKWLSKSFKECGLELSKYSNNNRLFSFIARFLVTLLFIQIKIDLSMNTCMFEVTDRNVNGDVSASSSKRHVRLVLSGGQENQSTDEVPHSPRAFFQDNNISKGIVRSK